MQHPHLIPEVHLYIVQVGAVLLMRRTNTGYMDGYYGLVAGHVERGEDFIDAIQRETAEEVGVVVARAHLAVVHVMYRVKTARDERIAGFVHTDRWRGEPAIMEPEKCDDLDWFPLNDLPENVVPYVQQGIECIQQGIFYSQVCGER